MLLIILKILQVIGVILLCLLGVVVLLLLLILFVPIRYKLSLQAKELLPNQESVEEGLEQGTEESKVKEICYKILPFLEKDEIVVNAKVSWLLNLFRVKFHLLCNPKEDITFLLRVLVLFLTVFRIPAKPKKYKEKNSKKNLSEIDELTESDIDVTEEKETINASDIVDASNIAEVSDEADYISVETDSVSDKTAEEVREYTEKKIEESKQKNRNKKKISNKLSKEYKNNKNIEMNNSKKSESDAKEQIPPGEKTPGDRLYELGDKLEKIEKKINFLTGSLMAESITKVKNALGVCLKEIAPRKVDLEAVFGTGSPDSTGILYGLYCSVLLQKFGEHVNLTPEFEKAILSGDFELSGRIQVYVFVIQGCKLFFDRDIRRTLRKLKS